jgi:hypothetical protein
MSARRRRCGTGRSSPLAGTPSSWMSRRILGPTCMPGRSTWTCLRRTPVGSAPRGSAGVKPSRLIAAATRTVPRERQLQARWHLSPPRPRRGRAASPLVSGAPSGKVAGGPAGPGSMAGGLHQVPTGRCAGGEAAAPAAEQCRPPPPPRRRRRRAGVVTTANLTSWRFLPPRQSPPSWDREFTAPCPHGRDVTWVAAESVDERRSWAVPGCDCEPAGDAQGGLCLSAAPGGPSERSGAGTRAWARPGVDLCQQSVTDGDAA